LVGAILIAVSALSVSVALPLVLLWLARRLATKQNLRRPVAL
jgi:hypothetical protein